MQTPKELFEQSGWKALNRIGTFAEMHHIFKQNFSDLNALLMQIKKNEDGENAWLHLSQYIFNFLASSFSLCEHCRKMMAFYKGTELYKEYEKKTLETFNNNLCAFIHKFRNYQTHYQIEFAYSDTQKNTVVFLSENLLKDKSQWKPNLLPRNAKMDERYKNPDKDPRGPWMSSDLSVRRLTPKDIYEITTPSGKKYLPTAGRSWGVSQETMLELIKDHRIWFGEKQDNMPRLKRFLSEVKTGATSLTVWTYEEVGHNQDAKKEVKQFNPEDVFATPKPERLIERVLILATQPGDLVLDSFLGSGTTAAVAHKMGRKYIGIELGEHCHTHCIPRLQKVIDGTDQGGISKAVNWQGGGGFKYYYLAPSLLNKDKYGQYVISKEYNADMLAAAVAKNEGFKYAPSQEQFWKQGQSSEADFIYTTTNHVGAELLSAIAQDMKPGESLLICCKSFDSGLSSRFANITVKKIPAALLGRCEFGKDNYNLNIINPPVLEEEEE